MKVGGKPLATFYVKMVHDAGATEKPPDSPHGVRSKKSTLSLQVLELEWSQEGRKFSVTNFIWWRTNSDTTCARLRVLAGLDRPLRSKKMANKCHRMNFNPCMKLVSGKCDQ